MWRARGICSGHHRFDLNSRIFSGNEQKLSELTIVLLSISSFGYIMTALSFVNISSTPLWQYKSLQDMLKVYVCGQYFLVLFGMMFLEGLAVCAFSVGFIFMAIVALVGLTVMGINLVRDWRARAKQAPPKKQE